MSGSSMTDIAHFTRTSRLAASIVWVLAMTGAGHVAFAQTEVTDRFSGNAAQGSRVMTVELNKVRLIELPRDVAEVVIANSAVVEAVVRTPRRVHLLGQQIGETSAVFVGRDGTRILNLDITVERDLAPVAAAIRRLIPAANVRLESVNDNIVLTGTVPSPLDASRVADIAGRFTPKREQILNMLNVEAKEQVLLRVTVAEVNRSVIRRLGVDLREALASGNFALAKVVENAFPVSSGVVAAGSGVAALGAFSNGKSQITAVLEMLERNGLARTLAEPNLTSVSGETADFLAGGEYPVPVGSENDTTTIAFKPFGVKLAFTPVVLSEGRISLKIATEVSELSSEGAVTVNAISIPALKVRRASSTLELPSGGSLVMAGLISSQMLKSVEGVPGIRDLPVLGKLFRSDDFIRSESEMVVIVTPYLVGTAARQDLRLPGEEAAPGGVTEAALSGGPPAGAGEGGLKDFGFIIE
jgi:pilus assembly protein CpaC